MSGMARSEILTGRLDAIVYRSRGPGSFYVSEYASSVARGSEIGSSLHNLAAQVRNDVSLGIYSLPGLRHLRTFVTMTCVPLELREGRRAHWFLCRVDEIEDLRGRRYFEATCPTNYLHEAGKSFREAVARLRDVLQARYGGEGLHDLMREMPKCPIVTTLEFTGKAKPGRRAGVITRSEAGYTARFPGSEEAARGRDPSEALLRLEESQKTPRSVRDVTLSGEPFFCALDVPLPLLDGTQVHRFLVTVSPHAQNGSSFFVAHSPQAGGISVKSPDFDEALRSLGDAIALEFRERSRKEVQGQLKKPVILATAVLPENE